MAGEAKPWSKDAFRAWLKQNRSVDAEVGRAARIMLRAKGNDREAKAWSEHSDLLWRVHDTWAKTWIPQALPRPCDERRRCSRCGAATDTSYRLCDPCFHAWTTGLRRRTGVSPWVIDVSVLNQIAALINTERRDTLRQSRPTTTT